MKTLKLVTVIFGSILLLLMDSSIINAQKSHVSLALTPIFPSLNLTESASPSFINGNISYSYDLSKKVTWILTIAYNKFGSKTATVFLSNDKYESKLAYIPITTGFQYFFNDEEIRCYMAGKVGYYFPSSDFEKGGWGAYPEVGLQIPIKNSNIKIDISFLYNVVFGGETKEYTLAHGQISGSTKYQWGYNIAAYYALNIGVVFDL